MKYEEFMEIHGDRLEDFRKKILADIVLDKLSDVNENQPARHWRLLMAVQEGQITHELLLTVIGLPSAPLILGIFFVNTPPWDTATIKLFSSSTTKHMYITTLASTPEMFYQNVFHGFCIAGGGKDGAVNVATRS